MSYKKILSNSLIAIYTVITVISSYLTVAFIGEKFGIDLIWESDAYFHPVGLMMMTIVPLYLITTPFVVTFKRYYFKKGGIFLLILWMVLFITWSLIFVMYV